MKDEWRMNEGWMKDEWGMNEGMKDEWRNEGWMKEWRINEGWMKEERCMKDEWWMSGFSYLLIRPSSILVRFLFSSQFVLVQS